MPGDPEYAAALARGRAVYDGTRIGRPGRGWGYWVLFPLAQALRARWRIRVTGREHVRRGPAILVGNHLSLMDPVLVGVSSPWRLTFFTKEEVFGGPGGAFFRLAGQIPLRRGDEAATVWALDMSRHALGLGSKLCLYPEATRSPDGRSLHRLHRRVLVPVLQANPGVPVHAMTIEYGRRRRGRVDVDIRFSAPLALDADAMTANGLTDTVRDAILGLGGMPYVHAFGRAIKGGRA